MCFGSPVQSVINNYNLLTLHNPVDKPVDIEEIDGKNMLRGCPLLLEDG